jgi:hypothetical protein
MNNVIYVAFSWLFYSILGLTVALLNGEKFDAKKLTRSLLWAILAAILAVVTQQEPVQLIAQHRTLIDALLTLLMNSSPAIALIWFFERLYLALTAIIQHARATESRLRLQG